MLSPSCGTSLPCSSRNRVCTPATGVPTQPGRRSPSARVESVIIVSLIPYRSIGARPVSAVIRSNTGTGSGALPETSSRAPDNARAGVGVLRDPRPHRRHPEVERAPRCGVRLGRRPTGVHQPRSGAQRARARRGSARARGTAAGRAPGCPSTSTPTRRRARRSPPSTAPPAQHHPLRRAGGSGGVEHERRAVRVGFGVAVPRPRVQPDRDGRQIGVVGEGALRPRPQPRLRSGIAQHVRELGGSRRPAAPERP